MSTILQAADYFEREVARAESLVAVAADLKKVGSLQQVANEAEGKLAAMQRDIKALAEAAALESANRVAIAAQQRAELEKLNRTIEQARTDRAAIVEDARAQAATIEAAAKTHAAAIQAKAEEAADMIVAAATAKAATYAPAIEAAEAKLADLNNAVFAAQDKLAGITGRIEELKARF